MPGIVVGVDGSEASLRAVDWAAVEAARRRVGLTVCVVVYGPPEEAVLWAGSHMTPMLAEQVMRRAVERAGQAAVEVSVGERVSIGAPLAHALADGPRTPARTSCPGRPQSVVHGGGGAPTLGTDTTPWSALHVHFRLSQV